MFGKISIICALLAVCSAQSYHGYNQHELSHHHEEHHEPAHYEFHYDVQDHHTGDVHGQKEVRKDHTTQGEYYLIDADGHKRTVTYHVDGKSGFIAQVHREPIKGYQAPQQQQHRQYQQGHYQQGHYQQAHYQQQQQHHF